MSILRSHSSVWRRRGGHQGGPAGDPAWQVNVREHAIFQRDGKHLYCGADQLCRCRFGWRAGSADPDGRVKLKIPEGTQTGKQFRLRGKGSRRCAVVRRRSAVSGRGGTPVNLSASA
ncbi:DnaJ C-terminal domain-containing protein [Stutzerimonas xanthomarina]|uniref:DnaJ C-terminal domain-containing protein n=1 Tax=Stutzerimonas xanthomarina TaxID=271420 RepID=UPI003AA92575